MFLGFNCASNDTVSSVRITHAAAFAAGWKLVGSGCSTGNIGSVGKMCTLFKK